MYNVIFDEESIDFLNTLPKEIKERIFKKIISSKENPLHFFERLAGRSEYKLRIGDYRVIANIDQAHKKVHITFVGHRKNVYEKI